MSVIPPLQVEHSVRSVFICVVVCALREARNRELEQRIRTHVQMMQQRHRRSRGPPAEEAKAVAQEMEEVKK